MDRRDASKPKFVDGHREELVAAGACAIRGISEAISTWHESEGTPEDKNVLEERLVQVWRRFGDRLGVGDGSTKVSVKKIEGERLFEIALRAHAAGMDVVDPRGKTLSDEEQTALIAKMLINATPEERENFIARLEQKEHVAATTH